MKLGTYQTIHGASLSYSDGRMQLAEGVRGLSTLAVTRDGLWRINSSDIEFATSSVSVAPYAFVTDTRSLRVLEVLVPDWLRER